MGAIYPDLKESTRLINTRRATDKTLSCFWNEFVCYLVLFYSLYARWEKKATLGESLNDYVRLFTVIRTQHNVTNEIYSLLYWQFQYFQNLYPNWIDFCWNFFFFQILRPNKNHNTKRKAVDKIWLNEPRWARSTEPNA